MSAHILLDCNLYWRHDELLRQATSERLAALTPRRASPVRVVLARVLIDTAQWLNPQVREPVRGQLMTMAPK